MLKGNVRALLCAVLLYNGDLTIYDVNIDDDVVLTKQFFTENKENESFLSSRAFSTPSSLNIQSHSDYFHVLKTTSARRVKKSCFLRLNSTRASIRFRRIGVFQESENELQVSNMVVKKPWFLQMPKFEKTSSFNLRL